MRGLLRRHAPRASVITSVALLALAFGPLYGVIGPVAGALVVVPVVVAAWSFKPRAVVAVSVLVGVIQSFEYAAVGNLVGRDPRTAIGTMGAVALVGCVLSYAREAQRGVARLTRTDPTTGLLNRTAFLSALEGKLRVAYPASSDLILIQITDFQQINESFGDEAGYALRRSISQRLRSNAEGDDRVSRIGSDKFLIWLRAGATPMRSAQSVLAVMAEPFEVSGTELRVEFRVAVARHPNHGNTAKELVARAEIALDEAQTRGQTAVVATARSAQEQLSRVETVAALRTAIGNGELRLHYQPIVELPSTTLRGVEALIRWQHPERGLLEPSQFIPLAEQSGLIVPLTRWLVTEALRQSRVWSDQGLSIRISLNVAAKGLAKSAGLPEMLGSLLRESGVDPQLLTLEVTESDVMVDVEYAIACLREVKALGLRIEIDDFGTGYSSLAYLQRLPVDAVKIDRSFITPLIVDPSSSAIVRAAIELSHALGLEAIAEGVEDPAVIEMLGAMGCDFAQGHAFARPMPADALAGWIASHSAVTTPVAGRPPMPTLHPEAGSIGTVLIVDDEHPFRTSVHRILTAQGYAVLHAATASEALRLCAVHHDEIDLVLTDLFLTDWQGDKLASHLRKLYPKLRVMFMSGDPSGYRLAGAETFLAKPFSRRQLVAGVAGALAA